jgi:CubicO group peptidase (beta-lactamase class C family)
MPLLRGCRSRKGGRRPIRSVCHDAAPEPSAHPSAELSRGPVVMTTIRARGHRVKKTGIAFLATGALLVLAGAPAATAHSAQVAALASQRGASIARAERVLHEQLDASGIPGGAVVVVSGGQMEARGVGDAGNGHPVTEATPFVLGSATKSFTALAVMQLVDSGHVMLDAPVRRYVPDLQLAAGEPVDHITVRQLLQQTSGLDDIAGGALLASAADGTPAQAIAELKHARLASAPGQRWLYANVNYVLAGLVIERVSGLSYGDFVKRHIFRPLGMKDSYVSVAAAQRHGLATGHRFWFGLPIATGPRTRVATLAAGYLISTAEDVGRYLAMYLSGGVSADGHRLMSAKAMKTMTSPGPEAHLGPWAQGQSSRYAMGWFRGGPWGAHMMFHPGNTPDTSTMLTVFPYRQVAVATLVNAGNELPVPGNPFIADRVERNVIHAALGQPVVDLPSLRMFYLLFDLMVLGLLAATGWGLLRAARSLRDRQPQRHLVLRWLGILVRTAVVAGLVVLPILSYGWRGLWTWAPDLALVMGSLALLLATTTALRVIAATRGHRPPAHQSFTTEIGGQRVHP